MPDVVGMHLDVAKTTIEQAGFLEDVTVDGGGTFGVVVESNWTVCEQSLAAGADLEGAAITLSVDRECGGASADPTATEAALDPSTAPDVVGMTLDAAEEALDGYVFDTYDTSGEDRNVWVASNWTVTAQRVDGETLILDIENVDDGADTAEAEEPAAEETTAAAPLTIENNEDLAALLTGPDDWDLAASFAEKYAGQTIEFDGVIGAMANHGDYDTRFDILVAYGDDANVFSGGPSFQFNDVNMGYDMHWVGDVPDTIGVNTKLHVVATVGEFSTNNGLFQLDPVETSVNDRPEQT